jgi:VWFA-related protein
VTRGLAIAVLLAPALTLPSMRARAQDPVFSARVEGVRIDALVTAGGRPLVGLRAEDFDVRDNGVRQTVDLVSVGDVPVNVVLTLDLSRSVDGPALATLKAAGGSLLEALTTGDTAALITFNRAVVLEVPLTADLAAVRQGLARAQSGGDTSLIDAAMAAMLLGDSDASRTLVVVFSDGVDTASFSRAKDALETARRVNGVVYAVSTSRDEPRFLRDVTAATGGRVIEVGEGGDPGPAFLEILQEFRRRYVLSFAPTGVAPGGWHALQVRVARSGARVQARSGYFSGRR